LDKAEAWNMCTLKYCAQEDDRMDQIMEREPMAPYEAQKIALEQLLAEGVLCQGLFYRSLEEYCNLAIDDALRSRNVLIRALAMLDCRLGKRRLARMDLEGEHQMVRRFHTFRCTCEGIEATTSSPVPPGPRWSWRHADGPI
jgi:hypothetical protein